jgi:hypothetical protein
MGRYPVYCWHRSVINERLFVVGRMFETAGVFLEYLGKDRLASVVLPLKERPHMAISLAVLTMVVGSSSFQLVSS